MKKMQNFVLEVMSMIAKTQLRFECLMTMESNYHEKKKQKLDTKIGFENLCLGLIETNPLILD